MEKTIAMILFIALVGYLFNQNIEKDRVIHEKDEKIVKLENEIKDEAHEKKQACVNTDLEKIKRSQDIYFLRGGGGFLYSEKIDSCIWYYYNDYNSNYEIKDIWNSKLLLRTKVREIFEKKVSELQWG